MPVPLLIEWTGDPRDLKAIRMVSSEERYMVIALNDVSDTGEEPDDDEEPFDLIDSLANGQENLEILTLSPLTDLAASLEKNPQLKDKIARVHIVGVNGPGQESAGEAASADPAALRAVLASGVPVTLYCNELLQDPASACAAAAMMRPDIAAFRECGLSADDAGKISEDENGTTARVLTGLDEQQLVLALRELALDEVYRAER